MINSKEDLRIYLMEDARAMSLDKKNKRKSLIFQYVRALRYHEYWSNCHSCLWHKIPWKYWAQRHRKLGLLLGYSIPIRTCGKGLSIAHVGTIVINDEVRIGDYCRLHVGTNIGTGAGDTGCPVIGNRVYIGPGAKIFGPICIGNDIAIGANAVVNKCFVDEGISIAGVPAQKISDKGSLGLLYTGKTVS